jgi:hypothetical protein
MLIVPVTLYDVEMPPRQLEGKSVTLEDATEVISKTEQKAPKA